MGTRQGTSTKRQPTVQSKQHTPSASQLGITTGCCTSPGLQANDGPTSQCVEIGLCKHATSHQQSSLSGQLLGSISASNTPPPPPQQRPPPAPGMASFSAYASQLSTRATGASLHHALPSMPTTCRIAPMQRVPEHLPLVEAKRCPASSVVCCASVTLSPRRCRGMHSLRWAPHASPVYSHATLPITCQHHDATTSPAHVNRNSSRHTGFNGSPYAADIDEVLGNYFPVKTRRYSWQ